MKLLFENWRKYLSERKTDELYVDLVNFFVEMYTTPENYQYKDDAEEEEYEGPQPSAEEWADILKLFDEIDESKSNTLTIREDEKTERTSRCAGCQEVFFLLRPRAEELWDRFNKEVPGGAELLNFENQEQFVSRMASGGWLEVVYGMENSDISYAYETEDKQGNIKTRQPLGVYADGQLIINFGSASFKDWTAQRFRKADLLGAIAENQSLVRAVIEHELTHMINHLRAGTLKRSKGISRQHRRKGLEKQGKIKYANSTEEIQARLVPIFKLVADGVRSGGDSPGRFEQVTLINAEVENFEGNQNLRNIVKLLWSIHDQEHPHMGTWYSQKSRQRITNRFYEFAAELINK